jgi:hypothetical protein
VRLRDQSRRRHHAGDVRNRFALMATILHAIW